MLKAKICGSLYSRHNDESSDNINTAATNSPARRFTSEALKAPKAPPNTLLE
jgi:hypothetical protein